MSILLICSIGISLGLLLLFAAFFIRTNRKESERINSIRTTVLSYRQEQDSSLEKFRKKISNYITKLLSQRSRNNRSANMLEILKQPEKPMPIGYAEYTTFKSLSPFIFAILFGFAGFSTKDFLLAVGLISAGFLVGIIAPTAILSYFYNQYKNDLINELSEIMIYIVDLRKAGQTIPDSIRGALFATNKLRPHLEKLLQAMSIIGPKQALAKLSKETDIDELKNLADILMQSITIDSSNMVAYMASRSRDIDYIEGLKEIRRYKNKKMLIEALTTIPFIMIPIIIIVPLLYQANQSLGQIM
jgi:Flp pilus assembly protein TadB